MKNRKLLVRASKKCMMAIMSAMFVMTPVCASLVMPLGSYAETIADNPAGETVLVINAGDSMENNYGTVLSNFGTIEYNMGEVRENAGIVNDNWGEVKNTDAADKANLVVNNHTPGSVIGGNVTNNWGTVDSSNVTVTNNNLTNDPHPTAPLNVVVEPIVFAPEPEPEPVSDNRTDYEQMKDVLNYMDDVYRFVAKVQNIPDLKRGSDSEKVYEIDMGRQTNFNDKMLEALGVDSCKNYVEIHFFYQGKDYYLVIPAGASLKAAYDYVKENGMQGFMCIHDLIDGSVLSDRSFVNALDSNDSGDFIPIDLDTDILRNSVINYDGLNIPRGITDNNCDVVDINDIVINGEIQAENIEKRIKEQVEPDDYLTNPYVALTIMIPPGEYITYIPENETLEDFIRRLKERVPEMDLDVTFVETE